jgi:hypothetical protein
MSLDSAKSLYEELFLVSRRPTRLSIEMLERARKNEENEKPENSSGQYQYEGRSLSQNSIA